VQTLSPRGLGATYAPTATDARTDREAQVEATLLGLSPVVWIAGALALYMAWGIGANDVANAMGTSVGSGSLTIRRAILIAGVLEFTGAFLAGGHVTDTVRKGIIDTSEFAADPQPLVYGMLASLAAAATLLLGATRIGLPVSTTHSIVGAIVGFGAVTLGADAVNWGKVAQIVASWITSPLMGGGLAFCIFHLVQRTVLNREHPMEAAKSVGPFFVFAVFFIIGLVTMFKGLKHVGFDLDFTQAVMRAGVLAAVAAVVARSVLVRIKPQPQAQDSSGSRFRDVERVFAALVIMTASSVAFAHGSNDVANAIGPLATIINVEQGMDLASKAPVAPWMLMIGGIGIVIGLGTLGYRVIETIGKKITELTPSRAFAAELAAATTIVLASRLGIPVSTTHILVGSVLGVGLARGIGALDSRVLGKILLSWVATLPIAAALSIFFFYFFKGLLTP
jgi:PiT family inorganic phosphate transporter